MVPEPEETPLRFSLDSSLGRLARWLRLLGHDAAWERNDDLATATARARAEDRLLLTRSRDLHRLGLAWPPRGGLVLISDDPVEQLVETAARWPVFATAVPLSRCAECNRALTPIDPEEARRRVPPFVARTQHEYRMCPSCSRIYWTATHAAAIAQVFREAAQRAGQPYPGAKSSAGPDQPADPAREN